MASKANVLRFDHLTYRGNGRDTRYGWLRLTPAFSVHLVQGFVRGLPSAARVLDPFCGTGTTALVCAEQGVHCETTDINPFLLWLAETKCRSYSPAEIERARSGADRVVSELRGRGGRERWFPALHQIDKWWEPNVLHQLAKICAVVEDEAEHLGRAATNLLKVSFCRTMIEVAKVSFSHQSMSFKKPRPTLLLDFGDDDSEMVIAKWLQSSSSIFDGATTEIVARPRFVCCDARDLATNLPAESFDCVVTSPPYPNRMSYIRELRPYMYWLGYLDNGKDAGDLDWQAIGGTWGCATSNLTRWRPPSGVPIPHKNFDSILSRIASTSPLLSRYVHKYFCDMGLHVKGLFQVIRPGGSIHYIIGNSKFYDVLLPAHEILATQFSAAGFSETRIEIIRKRTSKKELFEYVVSARKLGTPTPSCG